MPLASGAALGPVASYKPQALGPDLCGQVGEGDGGGLLGALMRGISGGKPEGGPIKVIPTHVLLLGVSGDKPGGGPINVLPTHVLL